MDRSQLLKKVATILGVSDTEKELAFEVLLEKISELLEPDEAIKVPDLGYFQVKKKPTKLVERIIESDLGAESKDTLLFSPVTDELAEKELMFLTFEINAKQGNSNKVDENVFDIGFGKPILPLAKEIGQTDSDTSYLLLKKSIEERVLELLSGSDKLENFDLWEEYLQQLEIEDENSIKDNTLSELNIENTEEQPDDEDTELIQRAIVQETVFDDVEEDKDNDENEDEDLIELMKNENLSLTQEEPDDNLSDAKLDVGELAEPISEEEEVVEPNYEIDEKIEQVIDVEDAAEPKFDEDDLSEAKFEIDDEIEQTINEEVESKLRFEVSDLPETAFEVDDLLSDDSDINDETDSFSEEDDEINNVSVKENDLAEIETDQTESTSVSFVEEELKNEFGAFSDQKEIHDRMAAASKDVLDEDTEIKENEIKGFSESEIEDEDLFSLDFFEKEEDLIKETTQNNLNGLQDNTEENETITKSEERMGDDNNKDSLEWDFEEIHDDDNPEETPAEASGSEEDEDADLFKKLEESLADENSDSKKSTEADSILGDFEGPEEEVSETYPDTTGITLDRSEMELPVDEDVEKAEESIKASKSYSDMRKNDSGKGKLIFGLLASVVIVVFVIVYFFSGSNTLPNNNLAGDSTAQITNDDSGEVNDISEDNSDVISIDKDDDPIQAEQSDVVRTEQPPKTVVKQQSSGGDLVRVYENEKSVGNLIFFNGKDYYFQVSSHNSLDKAKAAANVLRQKGLDAFVMKAWISKYNAFWYRVKIGFFKSQAEAKNFQRNNKF